MIKNWRTAFLLYFKPVVFGMVALGFSAGLPYQLIFFTFAFWLRDVGVDHATIGFLSWIGVLYAMKIFLSFVVDRFPLPLLTSRLGKRRCWMLFSQICIAAGLVGMSLYDPSTQLPQLTFLAIVIIFSSAIQDVVVDAYRIEAVNADYQGAMSAAYVTGYRIALLTSGAGALYIAEYSSWKTAYFLMASTMIIGIVATFFIREPDHPVVEKELLFDNVLKNMLSPFIEFFQRNGRGWGFVILLFVGIYKMSDITLSVMSGSFYMDLGFTKSEIANVTKVFSFFAAIVGATFGGILVVRFSVIKPLLFGTVAASVTNLLFVALAVSKPTLTWLAIVVTADSFFASMATTILIAYLSSLINKEYTATQYALFSSLITLPSQTVGGFSGMIVDYYGYPIFFIYTTAVGLPAILLAVILIRKKIQ
jgi:PAT family beta-lactamase induction signal transducer AmpG